MPSVTLTEADKAKLKIALVENRSKVSILLRQIAPTKGCLKPQSLLNSEPSTCDLV